LPFARGTFRYGVNFSCDAKESSSEFKRSKSPGTTDCDIRTYAGGADKSTVAEAHVFVANRIALTSIDMRTLNHAGLSKRH
jgi:hypothetical protein